ncbi:hypothetical protein CISIN_1g042835mg [Citrus sinensis]|uniref:Uncharacterized protein n=1 Tax=Citrus sinensis TaxID=2711 RepID=A0A067D5J7_CITSI|nr:hypothetical protein CISIN_1g042835mg [Citrus sinensis]
MYNGVFTPSGVRRCWLFGVDLAISHEEGKGRVWLPLNSSRADSVHQNADFYCRSELTHKAVPNRTRKASNTLSGIVVVLGVRVVGKSPLLGEYVPPGSSGDF